MILGLSIGSQWEVWWEWAECSFKSIDRATISWKRNTGSKHKQQEMSRIEGWFYRATKTIWGFSLCVLNWKISNYKNQLLTKTSKSKSSPSHYPISKRKNLTLNIWRKKFKTKSTLLKILRRPLRHSVGIILNSKISRM